VGVKPSARRFSGGWLSVARGYEFAEHFRALCTSGWLQATIGDPGLQQEPRRQMIEARPFGMHLLASGTGIRKTLSTPLLKNQQIQGLDYL
jgi:hypothetical protein